MKKRCVIGKSCGATCIHRVKVCRVELAAALSSSVAQTRNALLTSQPKTAAPEQKSTTNNAGPEKSTPTNPWGINGTQQDTWKTLLSDVSSDKDFRVLDSAARITAVTGLLGNTRSAKLVDKIKRISDVYASFMDKAGGNFERFQKEASWANLKIPSAMVRMHRELGPERMKETLKAVRLFTSSSYTLMRAAQRGTVPRGQEDAYPTDKMKKDFLKFWGQKADDAEAFIRYQPKPVIPKFRGVAVSDDKLKDLLQLVESKGVMTERSMNSWSSSPHVARGFADEVGAGRRNRVVYRTVNRNGAVIRGISSIRGEDEILTPSNSRYQAFKVHEMKSESGPSYYMVDAVEF